MKVVRFKEAGWGSPREVTDFEFGIGGGNVDRLLPELASVPEEFREGNEWTTLARRVLETGIPQDHDFVTAPGIDLMKAWRHIGAAFLSQADDERKVAGVAWLMSQWFVYARLGEHEAGVRTDE